MGSPRDRQESGLLPDRLAWLPDVERNVLLRSVGVARLPSGQETDVIEAVGEGVIFNHLGRIMDTHVNRLLVLRPNVDSEERTQALANVFLFLGDEYDFEFDFADAGGTSGCASSTGRGPCSVECPITRSRRDSAKNGRRLFPDIVERLL